MSKIADELGINRSTVFRYLNSSDGSRRAKSSVKNVPDNSEMHKVCRVRPIEAS